METLMRLLDGRRTSDYRCNGRPTRKPGVPRAMRAADHAAAHGFGGEFMHVCSRLRFAGGFDIDGVMLSPLRVGALPRELARGLVEAADDQTRDALLAASTSWLAAEGVSQLPALRSANHRSLWAQRAPLALDGSLASPAQCAVQRFARC
jgi:hypothetical protein